MKNLYFAFLALFTISLHAQTNYCQVRVGDQDNVCSSSWISGVSFANVNNANNLCDKEGGDPNVDDGYSDYSDMIGYIDPTVPTLLTVSLDGLFVDAIVAWIDWDNSGDWDDTEMVVVTGESTGTNQFTAVLSPPTGAVQDVEIIGGIRISSEFLTPNTFPCEDNLFGEIEDYSFIVTSAAPPTSGDNDYCTVRGDTPCNFQWIESFECNNISITDGFCDREDNDPTDPNSNPDGYSDYTEFYVEFMPGETTTATLTVDGNVLDQITAFIDWDNSGVWEVDELIYFTGETTVANMMTAAIVVPQDAVLGVPIKGGFRIKQDFLEPGTDPCANIGNGEIEDYSFIVLDPDLIACTDNYAPAKDATDQCTSLGFSWASVVDAGSYEFLLMDDNFDTVVNIIVSDTTYYTTLLKASSTYNWQVFPKDTTGRKAYGCDTATFSTASILAPTLMFQPDSISVCSNEKVTLTPVVNSAGNLSYTWSGQSTSSLSSISVENPELTPSGEGVLDFHLSIVDQFGCSAGDSLKVNVLGLPGILDYSLNKNIVCSGENAIIHLESDADSLIFLKRTGTASPIETTPINQIGNDYIFDGVAQNIYFTVLYLNGCSDTVLLDTISYIPELDLPVIVLENEGGIGPCEGSAYLLRCSNYQDNLEWQDGSVNDSLFISASTAVSLRYTSSGCVVQADTNIQMDFVPNAVTLNLSRAVEGLCEGDSIVISHSLAEDRFEWFDGDVDAGSRVWYDAQDVSIKYVSERSCEVFSDTVSLAFNRLPSVPVITVEGDSSSLCEGGFIYLSNDAGIAKTWSTGSNADSIFVFETGPYFIVVSENGCSTSSDTISINFNSQPEQPSIGIFPNGAGDSIWSTSEFEAYVWVRNDTILAENTRAISALVPGDYTLQVENEFGCSSPFSEFYTVEPTTGIKDLSSLGITMRYDANTMSWLWQGNASFDIRVVDINGRILSEGKQLSDFSFQPKHLVIVQIVAGANVYSVKLLPKE